MWGFGLDRSVYISIQYRFGGLLKQPHISSLMIPTRLPIYSRPHPAFEGCSIDPRFAVFGTSAGLLAMEAVCVSDCQCNTLGDQEVTARWKGCSTWFQGVEHTSSAGEEAACAQRACCAGRGRVETAVRCRCAWGRMFPRGDVSFAALRQERSTGTRDEPMTTEHPTYVVPFVSKRQDSPCTRW